MFTRSPLLFIHAREHGSWILTKKKHHTHANLKHSVVLFFTNVFRWESRKNYWRETSSDVGPREQNPRKKRQKVLIISPSFFFYLIFLHCPLLLRVFFFSHQVLAVMDNIWFSSITLNCPKNVIAAPPHLPEGQYPSPRCTSERLVSALPPCLISSLPPLPFQLVLRAARPSNTSGVGLGAHDQTGF